MAGIYCYYNLLKITCYLKSFCLSMYVHVRAAEKNFRLLHIPVSHSNARMKLTEGLEAQGHSFMLVYTPSRKIPVSAIALV